MATVRIQVRRGTASQWSTTNPVLAAGEMGVETDTNLFKFGNGTSTWTALSYANNSDVAIGEISQDAINNALSLGAGLTKSYNDGTNTIQITVDSDVIALKSYVDNAVDGIVNTADVTYVLQEDRGAVNGVASLNAQGKVPTSEIDLTVMATREYADYLQTQDLAALTIHTNNTLNAHGIADTSLLATDADVLDALNTAKSYTDTKKETIDNSIDSLSTTLQAYADTKKAEAITAAESYGDSIGATAASFATGEVSAHNSSTENVHGIADTLALATKSYADTAADGAETAAISAASTALSTHASDTTNVHGISDTSLLALKSEVEAVTKTTLGLGNVDNTADASKPVSTAQATAIATAKSEAIADATAQVNALLTGAPAALNTLDELAAALGDDANFAASVTTSLGLKVDSLTPITQKTSSYTLSSLTERDDLIEMGSSSALTLTIPADSALNFPIGTSIDILQTSTGQVTIAGAGGVNVNATPGLKLRTQWSSATLFKRAANTWIVMGDLTA